MQMTNANRWEFFFKHSFLFNRATDGRSYVVRCCICIMVHIHTYIAEIYMYNVALRCENANVKLMAGLSDSDGVRGESREAHTHERS